MAWTVVKLILFGCRGTDAVTSAGAPGGPSITRFSVVTDCLRRAVAGEGHESSTDWCDVAVWGH